ncbi:MAG: TetR/AcrR family transcriptional regulator [Proteobacteria bacterium]|nr:MAG: TetR/AcrR family transcriptional regulator [Pseudomonadota bacterium]
MKKISQRKNPLQNRSRQMVEDILKASIRILKKSGGKSFTTIRVAEAAGISVGSLYQYFPNKEAILFHLQEKEWLETWALMDKILRDKSKSPIERHHLFVRDFFKSEYEEADLRRALQGTGANFEKTRSYKELQERGQKGLTRFLKELLPRSKDIDFRVDFYMTTISKVAEDVSMRVRDEGELEKWSDEVSQMLLNNFTS